MVDPKLPPGHIGNIPAGHARDEENRRRTDDLAQKREEVADLGSGDRLGAIDPSKFADRDNEIMRLIQERRDKRGKGGGVCVPDGLLSDYDYAWVPQWDHRADEMIDAHLMQLRQNMINDGWERVEGNMPEGQKTPGKTSAGYRRWGDCVLYRIRKIDHEVLGFERMEDVNAQNNVERSFGAYGSKYAHRTGGNMAHGDPADPMIQRTVFAGGAGQMIAMEREIRTGRSLNQVLQSGARPPSFGGR